MPLSDLENAGETIMDVIASPEGDLGEAVTERMTRHKALYRAFSALDDVDAITIALRHGLIDGTPKTYDEIAAIRGVDRSRIGQQEKKALSILRSYSKEVRPLRQYAGIRHKREIPQPEGRIMVV